MKKAALIIIMVMLTVSLQAGIGTILSVKTHFTGNNNPAAIFSVKPFQILCRVHRCTL